MSNAEYSQAGQRRILCVGEALVDLIAEPGGDWGKFERLIPRIGGAPANMAVAIQRLGGRAAFLGTVADDGPGRWIAQRLSDEQVDVSQLRTVVDAQTRLALVTGARESRQFRFYGSPAADLQIEPIDIDRARIETAGAVITGSLLLTSEPGRSAIQYLLDSCVRNDIPFVFDPNPRDSIWTDPEDAMLAMEPFIQSATILKLSAEDLVVLNRSAATIRPLQPADSALIITYGEHGCRMWSELQDGLRTPAFSVKSVDSTGAGDAFTAALALRFVQNERTLSPDDVRFASAAGALATTRLGAMDSLPMLRDVQELMSAGSPANDE